MDIKKEVLQAMKNAGKPVNIGEVVKLSGLPRAQVEAAFKELKQDNIIISPIRCKWQPNEQ